MTNMKHLSPTPPTGHLTPGQKEGDNYQPNGAGKVIRKVSKNASIHKLVLSTSSTQGTHHDQMSSGEYLITLPFRFIVYLKPSNHTIHPLSIVTISDQIISYAGAVEVAVQWQVMVF